MKKVSRRPTPALTYCPVCTAHRAWVRFASWRDGIRYGRLFFGIDALGLAFRASIVLAVVCVVLHELIGSRHG